MMKRWIFGIMVVMFLAVVALPIQAAPVGQGEGGVHFGPYTLAAGSTVSGDLTVFGGPALLKKGSSFNGDLTVFGTAEVQNGATLNGTLVVFGSATVAGTIDGDVFVAGAVTLEETAHVSGDVSATGTINQRAGAVVEGDISPMSEEDFPFDRNLPIEVPSPWVKPRVQVHSRPLWLRVLWNVVRAVASVVGLSLLALLVTSVWPVQVERVGRVIEEAALTSFGMGLLALVVALIVLTLLLVTICLSPVAILGWLVIGVGVLLGWIALGLILGKRILGGVFNQPAPQPTLAAVVGTAILTLLAALARIFWPFYSILLFVLVPLAGGAVVLTRFGMMPYATQGGGSFPPRAPKPPRPAGPIVPAPLSAPQPQTPLTPEEDTEAPAVSAAAEER